MRHRNLTNRPSKAKQLAARCLALLTLLGLPAFATAQAPTPATRATASVEFFQGDDLDAIIEIESFFDGEEGNGLAISFSEEAIGVAFIGTNVIGNAVTGYTLQLNNDLGTISYDEIARAIESIAEIGVASLNPMGSLTYDASLQDPPAAVVLSGGADATVPEPSTAMLTLLLSTQLLVRRRRRS